MESRVRLLSVSNNKPTTRWQVRVGGDGHAAVGEFSADSDDPG